MPSNEMEGPCCVCGATAQNRCSACGKAGFSLWFCSEEHQKLVWFSHKRLCGKNSNPLTFPLFSKIEAELVLSYVHLERLDGIQIYGDGTEIIPLMRAGGYHSPLLVSTAFLIKGEVIRSLVEGTTTRLPPNLRTQVLAIGHGNLLDPLSRGHYTPSTFKLKEQSFELFPPPYDPLLIVSEFATLLSVELNYLRRPAREIFPTKEGWYVKLMHHAGESSPETPFLAGSLERLEQAAETVEAPEDVKKAAKEAVKGLCECPKRTSEMDARPFPGGYAFASGDMPTTGWTTYRWRNA
ncbi:hypothetical protein JCM8547_006849 [Rhodosporidiobolus lusitaniae]